VGAPVCCNGRGVALLAGKGEENGGTTWRPVSKRGGSGEEGKEMVVPAGSEK